MKHTRSICRNFFLSLAMAVMTIVSWSRADADLLVGSHDSNSILRYDENTGAYLGAFVPSGSGGLTYPHGLVFGPDGDLYVTGHKNSGGTVNDIFRYDGKTGAFLNILVPAATSGLSFSDDLVLGSDGTLFTPSYYGNQVGRFNVTTGAVLSFYTGGGLNGPSGLALDANGILYVGNQGNNTIVRFNTITGASLGTLVTSGSGGLSAPEDLAIGPDGYLYVASAYTNSVLRYNITTGNFLGAFVISGSGGLSGPAGLDFGPDGNLYVSSPSSNSILRYNGTTGAFLNTFVTPASGGLDFPLYMTFTPRQTAVPEPGTTPLLLAGGLTGMGLFLRRRRANVAA